MIRCGVRWSAAIAMAVAMSLAVAQPAGQASDPDKPTKGVAYTLPQWFKPSFLDFRQDVAEARKQGLKEIFTNVGTTGVDRQVVAVFVLDDAGKTDEVRDLVDGSVPKPSRVIVNGNVMVVYGPAGVDRTAQVQQAVEAL